MKKNENTKRRRDVTMQRRQPEQEQQQMAVEGNAPNLTQPKTLSLCFRDFISPQAPLSYPPRPWSNWIAKLIIAPLVLLVTTIRRNEFAFREMPSLNRHNR